MLMRLHAGFSWCLVRSLTEGMHWASRPIHAAYWLRYYSGKEDAQQTRRRAAHAAQRSKRMQGRSLRCAACAAQQSKRCVRGSAGLLVMIFVAGVISWAICEHKKL
jgi:hypothetical protein